MGMLNNAFPGSCYRCGNIYLNLQSGKVLSWLDTVLDPFLFRMLYTMGTT